MTTATPNRTRGLILNVFKWLLACGMLAFLYWKCGPDLAKLKDRQILPLMFVLALVVRIVSLTATFARWWMLVRGIGIPFTLREAFRLGVLGEACNPMAPGAVGGDLVKVGLLAKDHPDRMASVFATVFLDRVLGLWALFVLGALGSLIPAATKPAPELQWAVWVLWGGSAAGLLGLGLMFIPAFTHSKLMHWFTTLKFVGSHVKELMNSVELYQGKPQIVFGAAAMGLLGHFGFLTAFYFCAQSIHQGQSIPGFIDHIVGLPLPEAVSAAVPIPGGIGVLEGAVAWFYEQHQLAIVPDSTKEQLTSAYSNGLLTALGYRLTTFIWGAIGIVYYFSSRKEIGQAVHVVDTEPQVAT